MLKHAWPVLAALAVALPLIVPWIRRTEEGRRLAARVLLELPVIRDLRRQALGARVTRLVGVLVGGGAPLLAALEQATECLPDPLTRDESIRTRLSGGMYVDRNNSLLASLTAGPQDNAVVLNVYPGVLPGPAANLGTWVVLSRDRKVRWGIGHRRALGVGLGYAH